MNVNIMASSGNDPRLTQGTVVFSNLKLDLFLRWDASSRWSSLYCPIRNLDEITIGKTHLTLSFQFLTWKKMTFRIRKTVFQSEWS